MDNSCRASKVDWGSWPILHSPDPTSQRQVQRQSGKHIVHHASQRSIPAHSISSLRLFLFPWLICAHRGARGVSYVVFVDAHGSLRVGWLMLMLQGPAERRRSVRQF